MFKLLIEKTDDVQEKIDKIKVITKECGYVSVRTLIRILFGFDYPVNDKSSKMGWSYNTICEDLGITLIEDYGCPFKYLILELPDPVEYGSRCFTLPKCDHVVCVNRGTDLCNDCNGEEYFSLSESDIISHPSHYTEGRKYEPRKVIHDWDLNFNLGNAVKYIARAGRKGDKVEDLKKAIQYIKFEIEELEERSK